MSLKSNLKGEIVELLRRNPEKWYQLGHIVVNYEAKTENDKQILRMRIHRIFNGLVRDNIIIKRELENYEYKWKQ